jgi:hypothetical protein
VEQSSMQAGDRSGDALLKLAGNLRELEIVIGEKARPAVAEVRARLIEAAGKRQAGDVPGALEVIRIAMQRLANLGSQLDPAEGAMMRMIAERFTQALASGDKGTAADAVDVMRHKAGDTSKKGERDW